MLDITAAPPQTQSPHGDTIQVVRLGGRLDSATAREFDEFLARLLSTGKRFLLLEADELHFVSSAGLAVLVRLVRSLDAEQGAAAIVRANEEVAMLLEFFGLNDRLPLFDARRDAVDYLSARVNESQPGLSLAAEDSLSPSTAAFGSDEGSVRHAAEQPLTASDAPDSPRSRARPIVPVSHDADDISDVAVTAQPLPSLDEPEFRAALRSDIRRVIREEELARRRDLNEAGDEAVIQVSGARSGTASPPASGPGSNPAPGGSFNAGASLNAGASVTATTAASTQGAPGAGRFPLATPAIIACEQCSKKFRVRTAGKHMCPHCQVRVRVARDGSVAFMERL